MTRHRSKMLLVLTLACLSGPLMAHSVGGGQTEVLIGHFFCSAGTENGIAYMGFEGSGDVLLNTRYFYDNDITLAGSPAETCAQEVGPAHEVVVSMGCSASSIANESLEDGGAFSRFDFVCRDDRNGIIEDIAVIVGHLSGIGAP